jgi:predicted O-linked N-acetylglucosamine transferase (SPINDLY family)
MWMGVPVITLAGAVHASRVGVSLLTNVGVEELVARTGEEYVGKAAALAMDTDRVEMYRRTLRERMRGSALCDGKGLARRIEAAYREMWMKWRG